MHAYKKQKYLKKDRLGFPRILATAEDNWRFPPCLAVTMPHTSEYHCSYDLVTISLLPQSHCYHDLTPTVISLSRYILTHHCCHDPIALTISLLPRSHSYHDLTVTIQFCKIFLLSRYHCLFLLNK
jgi:hypothetical protein